MLDTQRKERDYVVSGAVILVDLSEQCSGIIVVLSTFLYLGTPKIERACAVSGIVILVVLSELTKRLSKNPHKQDTVMNVVPAVI